MEAIKYKNEIFGFSKKNNQQEFDLHKAEAHVISVVSYNNNEIKLKTKASDDSIAVFTDITLTNIKQTINPKISYLINYDKKESTIGITRSIENVNFINPEPKTLMTFNKIHNEKELYSEINSTIKSDISNLLKKIENKGYSIKKKRDYKNIKKDKDGDRIRNNFDFRKVEDKINKYVDYNKNKLPIRISTSVDNIACFCDIIFTNPDKKINPIISYLLSYNNDNQSITITRSIENVAFIRSDLKVLVSDFDVEDEEDIISALNKTVSSDLNELVSKIEAKGFKLK